MGIDVPLVVQEADGTPTVKAVRKIKLGTDLSLVDDGSGVVTVNAAGAASSITGSIADTQIAFGTGTNAIGGSGDFTFTADTGSGPTVRVDGDQPKVRWTDDTAADTYSTQMTQSGASFYILGEKNGTNNKEFFRLAHSTSTPEIRINDNKEDMDVFMRGSSEDHLLYCDAGNNRVGVFTDTPSARFTIQDVAQFDTDTITLNPNAGAQTFRIYGQTSDDYLWYDGTSLEMGHKDDGTGIAPQVTIKRIDDNPQDGDDLGRISWNGYSDDGDGTTTQQTYGYIVGEVEEADTANYGGALRFVVPTATSAWEICRMQENALSVGYFSGQPIDFRVYGSGSNKLLSIDATDDEVIVNESYDADAKFRIYATDGNNFLDYSADTNRLEIRRQTAGDFIYLFSGSDGSSFSPNIKFYARGATNNGDLLGELNFQGRNSGDTATVDYVSIETAISDSSSGTGYDGTLNLKVAHDDSASNPSSIMYATHNQMVINLDYEDVDFNVRDSGSTTLLHTDANNSYVHLHRPISCNYTDLNGDETTTWGSTVNEIRGVTTFATRSGGQTFNLPTLASGSDCWHFTIVNMTGDDVVIAPDSPNTINGAASVTNTTQYSATRVVCTGPEWVAYDWSAST